MNRKTNIFYNSSEDSKFLTFNNYTEALTGDILATDYKLWPSRFICAYIEDLDKEDFTLQLQKYYENKLATLRDNVDNIQDLKPLNYLITFMYWWAYNRNIANNNDKLSPTTIEAKLFNDTMKNSTELSNLVKLNYIGDIVEQQYNGTYTDIICTINPNKWNKPQLQFVTLNDNNDDADLTDIGQTYLENDMIVPIEKNDDNNQPTYLHGWENESQITKDKLGNYITSPIFDTQLTIGENNTNIYCVNSLINQITINDNSIDINNINSKLKFNIVIPLFNLVNIGNVNDISNDDENTTSIELNNMVNIPLGIYFTDNDIELTINGKFSTNWSLLISTQFSAFPFSYDIQQNFDDSQSTKQAYVTFAEILANQTNFTDALVKYDNLVKSLQKRIELLESKMNNISSVQNIDSIVQNINNIQTSLNNLTSDINDKLEELENKIEANKLKWQVNAKNNNQ